MKINDKLNKLRVEQDSALNAYSIEVRKFIAKYSALKDANKRLVQQVEKARPKDHGWILLLCAGIAFGIAISGFGLLTMGKKIAPVQEIYPPYRPTIADVIQWQNKFQTCQSEWRSQKREIKQLRETNKLLKTRIADRS